MFKLLWLIPAILGMAVGGFVGYKLAGRHSIILKVILILFGSIVGCVVGLWLGSVVITWVIWWLPWLIY